MKKQYTNFFIIGNGGSGTSLLCGLMNAHSKVNCLFESWRRKDVNIEIGAPIKEMRCDRPRYHFEFWKAEAKYMNAKLKRIYGNKIPLEQFITHKWLDSQILKLAEYFKIIYIIRRYSQYSKKSYKELVYQNNWKRSNRLYWKFRENHVRGVILVSFEDLLLRTRIELMRICSFLNIRYEKSMLNGTANTGYQKYDYGHIDISKL
jgi:hypothetical protein